MKLQDAFASEANAVGSWERIGYKMEPTTNFNYIETAPTGANDGTALITANGGYGTPWKVTNKVALNDCTANNCTWTLTMTGDAKGNGVKYTATTPADAKMLTPSFELIGK